MYHRYDKHGSIVLSKEVWQISALRSKIQYEKVKGHKDTIYWKKKKKPTKIFYVLKLINNQNDENYYKAFLLLLFCLSKHLFPAALQKSRGWGCTQMISLSTVVTRLGVLVAKSGDINPDPWKSSYFVTQQSHFKRSKRDRDLFKISFT